MILKTNIAKTIAKLIAKLFCYVRCYSETAKYLNILNIARRFGAKKSADPSLPTRERGQHFFSHQSGSLKSMNISNRNYFYLNILIFFLGQLIPHPFSPKLKEGASIPPLPPFPMEAITQLETTESFYETIKK